MFSPCSAKRRASDKDLPVIVIVVGRWSKITIEILNKTRITPRTET